jgi:hypothetical protein
MDSLRICFPGALVDAVPAVEATKRPGVRRAFWLIAIDQEVCLDGQSYSAAISSASPS